MAADEGRAIQAALPGIHARSLPVGPVRIPLRLLEQLGAGQRAVPEVIHIQRLRAAVKHQGEQVRDAPARQLHVFTVGMLRGIRQRMPPLCIVEQLLNDGEVMHEHHQAVSDEALDLVGQEVSP